MNYWNKEKECMPREELEKLQLRRLKETVYRVYSFVPAYKAKMDEAGVKPQDINCLADLKYLPFLTKKDFRDNYPFGLLAVPMSDVVRIQSSSGTTGKPTVACYTKNDIDNWAEMMARGLTNAGATRDSVIQITWGYGLFTGGLGGHYGAEKIGASVLPASGGNTKRQVMLMHDYGVTMLGCTPSYALVIYEELMKLGLDRSEFKLKSGLFGAEPWSENMRKEIENKWEIDAYDVYGMTELVGPGVAIDCAYKQGLHMAEDHFIAEIINPDTGEVLPEGSHGELVITSLTKEAFPVIRYRTRDLTSINRETCDCGRTHARIQKILGRSDDMLIIRGVNVFPSMVESILLQIPGIEPQYQLTVDRKNNLDRLEVHVEVSENVFSDEVRKLEELEARISRELNSGLGIAVKVRLVEPQSIERSEGKAKRIIDNRTI
ncbi:MAG TPA: phenylacetate--CoA ligase [Syntrophomonadaceae bacterium]|nr:phenylacetate--CoA ligase [Syntrophomonadaceae bacterium]